MSINWVMTSPGQEGFIKLPNERVLFTSPPRTHLQLTTPNSLPTAEQFSVKSEAGIVYITNQRIVYLPTTLTPELQSFSSPILNLRDTFVRAPFFGANYWVAQVKPVSGGGIPPTTSAVELRLTFREGGAFDFHSTFEQIKERLYQAYQVARESGQTGTGSAEVNLANVHLEQLPAYEAAREVQEEEPTILSPVPRRPSELRSPMTNGPVTPNPGGFTAPDEPPPGYEEAQAQAVSVDLDARLREEAERERFNDPSASGSSGK